MKHALLLLAASACLLAQTHPTLDFKTQAGPLKVTVFRHASFMIEAGGQVVHVDPVGDYAAMPKADLILITHTHGDHVDPKALAVLRKASTVVIAPEAATKQIEGAKVLANGGNTKSGPWSVEAVPAYNLQRGPKPGTLFHEKGNGNGYVVTYGGFRLYAAGDTENVPEMRNLKSIDVAFLPMHATYTMTVPEAVEAAKSFKPKVAIPYHYRGSDTSVFEKALAGSGIEVKLLDWYR